MTVVPKMQDRGAFISINASFQQIAGGVASVIAGMIITVASFFTATPWAMWCLALW